MSIPRMVLIAVVGPLSCLTSCAPVRPYSVTLPPPTETLTPPSAELLEYTSNAGLAVQVERVTLRCDQVRQAIAGEIDQRQRRITTTQRVLLTVGSLAALATTIYSGIKDEPSKNVVVPLTAVSGSALLTALPSLGKDERVSALAERLNAMKTSQAGAVTALNGLEGDLLAISLLRGRLAAQDSTSEEAAALRSQLEQQYTKTAQSEEVLRLSLATLVNDCN